MAKSKCKHCQDRKETREGVKTNVGFFCDYDHAAKYALNHAEKGRKKLIAERKRESNAKAKVKRKETAQRKKELRSRSDWLDTLQKLVNQYVTKVRDVNKPCCTCGTANPNIKYDAGHFFTRAARPDIRFELTNLHRQCSVNCNQYGSGMRKEYAEFIVNTYGQEHLDWLTDESQHKSLKEQFPHWSDIEKEIMRYRKLLRDNGIKPIA
ncbi:recombination protein NinG [Pseudoalteromonas sp.]|uniref:recombination protein NinG n=1 Tax=Pseudoalteromonas sp. TaxID=53249 RepID=UPI003D0E6B18